MGIRDIIQSLISGREEKLSGLNQERAMITQRLSASQLKTVEWLRRSPTRESATRIQAAKDYVDRQKRRADELRISFPVLAEPMAKYPNYPLIRGTLPITAKDAKSVHAFLVSNVAGDKNAYLKFPDGLSHKGQVWGACSKDDSPQALGHFVVNTTPSDHRVKAPSFGLELSASKEAGLQVTFNYRPVPGSLRLPENKQALGGLSSRLAMVTNQAATPEKNWFCRPKTAVLGPWRLELS